MKKKFNFLNILEWDSLKQEISKFDIIINATSLGLKNGNDFYMVGGMGHTSSVALGYSLSNNKKTICIDGDGSFLMPLQT